MSKSSPIRPLLSAFIFSLLLTMFSQTMFATVFSNAHPVARVTQKVDNSKRATLYGHTPRILQHSVDIGRVNAQTPTEHMVLVLKSSPDQEREARRVIDEQQDKHTVNYHQWMSPDDFGTHFGVHDDDIAKVKSWLIAQGFTIDGVNRGKRVIHFSGNIGQIEQAFQTQMHYFVTPNGETHVSNDRDITVPLAFQPVVAGIPTLNDFFKKSHMVGVSRYSQMRPGPKYTSSSTTHYVSPADFATIYNTAPLLAKGINGTGVSIGVVGRSDIL